MIPILYDAFSYNYKDIINNYTAGNNMVGYIADLKDTRECIITKEINGCYDLRLKYAIDGAAYKNLIPGNLILATAPTTDILHTTSLVPYNFTKPQFFRIYSVRIGLDDIQAYAHHISYELSWIQMLTPYPAGQQTIAGFLNNYHNHSTVTEKTFIIGTDSDFWTIPFNFDGYASLRSYMGGREGSILQKTQGEWDYDNFQVHLYKHIGRNLGVVLDYGYNLSTFNQNSDDDNTYGGIIAYVVMADGTMVYGSYDNWGGDIPYMTENYHRYALVDASSDYANQETPPSSSELRAYARDYYQRNTPYLTREDLSATYVIHPDSIFNSNNRTGQKHTPYDNITLGDTIVMSNPLYDIDRRLLRVVKVEFDVLKEKNRTLTLNKPKKTLAKTISQLSINQQELQRKTAQAGSQAALTTAASILMNGSN